MWKVKEIKQWNEAMHDEVNIALDAIKDLPFGIGSFNEAYEIMMQTYDGELTDRDRVFLVNLFHAWKKETDILNDFFNLQEEIHNDNQ